MSLTRRGTHWMVGMGGLLVLLLSLVLVGLSRTNAQDAGETVFAVTNTNNLLRFNSNTPGNTTRFDIMGLQPNETVQGIDFRPATGQLYAFGSTNRLYLINIIANADGRTSIATVVGTGPVTTTNLGASFGFDFNPTADRIRLVSNTGRNLRLNPDTGTVAANDTNVAYAAGDANVGKMPSLVGAAYTNNISTTATTTLFVLDATAKVLARQEPPNAGVLNTVGPTGTDSNNVSTDPNGLTGFDIAQSGIAYASISMINSVNMFTPNFFRVDLTTGTLTRVAPIGTLPEVEAVVDIAVLLPAPMQTTPTIMPSASAVSTATTAPSASAVSTVTTAPSASAVSTATTAPSASAVSTVTTAPSASAAPTATTTSATTSTPIPTPSLGPAPRRLVYLPFVVR